MAISFDPESKSYSDGVTTLEIKMAFMKSIQSKN